MGKTAKQWKEFYRSKDFQDQYCNTQEKLGMECTKEGTSFRLWSPVADQAEICFYRDGEKEEAYEVHPMKRQENGVWSYETGESLHGVYYDFLLDIEGNESKVQILTQEHVESTGQEAW